jgi:hypothetical protein
MALVCVFTGFFPPKALRFAFIFGGGLFLMSFVCALLPYNWKSDNLSSYYQSVWDQAKRETHEVSGYERVEFDDKQNNHVILYVKAFGLKDGDVLFSLLCGVPCAACFVEMLLRRKKSQINDPLQQ